MDVFDLYAKITMDTSEYESGLQGASTQTESFGSKLKSGLASAAKAGAAAIAAVTTAATAFTTALVKGVSQTASYGDNIDKMSQKLGMSSTSYQEWDAVMQHCGTSIESMQSSMKTLASAAETNKDAFDKLGMSQEEIANMSQEELFSATITALQNCTDETERTYLAGQLLGRGATELGALLNTSAEDTQAMKDRVHELGGVMSEDAVKAAAAYQDSLQDMKTAFSSISRGITSDFMPSITTVMDGLAAVFSGDSASGIGLIKSGLSDFLSTLSDTASEAWDRGKEIAESIASGLWESLDTALSESEYGDAWNAIKDSASEAVETITTAFSALKSAFQPIIDKVVEIKDGFVDYATSAEGAQTATDLICDAITGVANIIATVVTGFAEFVTWLQSGSTGATAFQTAVVAVVAALGAYQAIMLVTNGVQTALNAGQQLLTAGQAALNAVMNANPFVLVATLVAALAAGIIYLWNTNEGFRDAVTSAWEAIKSAAETVWNAVTGFFTETIPDAIDTALQYFDNLMNGSTEDMNAIEVVVSTVLNNVKTIFNTVLSAIQSIVDAVMSAINGDWSGALESLQEAAETIWEGIKTVFQNKIDAAKTIVSDALDAIKGYFTDKLTTAKNTVTNIFESIKTAISDKITSAKNTVSSVIDSIKAKFNFTWSLPHLKLPHVSISGSFSLTPPSVPHFSVSWYKKAMDIPMILSGATIFGAMGGNLLGGGESGSEIVAGQETLMDMIREASGATDITKALNKLVSTDRTPVQIIINGADYETKRDLAETVAQYITRDAQRRGAALA